MARITCDFFSDALETGVSVTVLLPQPTAAQIGVERTQHEGLPPVLYLLHGLSDDHTAWTRYTSVERYCDEVGLAVVMPGAGRSFYADEAHGHRYWEHVAEELPQVVGRFFRVSADPAQTFVAGLSMGGYGALKLALTHPDRYAAAASLSGALDVVGLAAAGDRSALFERVFDGTPGPDADLFALLERAERVPPLHVSCGTEDELLESNHRFVAAARERGAEVTTHFPAGEHEWGLWDAVLPDVIAWLPLPRRSAPE